MKNKLIFSLSLDSKNSLYKSFLFYTLSPFTSKVLLRTKIKFSSFKAVILNQIPLNEKITKKNLARAQVLCINNSFLYLNLGEKFTLVKPKFKSLFVQIISKEFLFLTQKVFFKNLKLSEIKVLLKAFQFTSFKIFEFLPSLNIKDFNFRSLKKLILSSNKYSDKFFFFKESTYLFSNFQKKINFFQFNILFKKYKYILK